MARILIVDDSPTMRQLLAACLTPLAAELAEASTGLEAVERLTIETFDLVFLDINMPDMDGVEVVAFLKSHPSLARVPVVMVTTRSDPGLRDRLLAQGVNRYITKPFEPDQVLEAARELLAAEA
ncbi:MAG: response regulator [Candidatus Dadabacteria bacterium]|nr:MAG: response regulator [Candidatus Dadabacteria bacterium]